MLEKGLKIIDIGHSNYGLDTAISLLETIVSQSAYESKTRGIKIITGHGSGKLRNAVRDWCLEQEGRFRAVNQNAVGMRIDCEQPNDPDYGRKNRAVTYIWLW